MADLIEGGVPADASRTATDDASVYRLTIPETNQPAVVEVSAGDQVHLDFPLDQAQVAATETDLIFQFEAGQSIVLLNYISLLEAQDAPQLVLPDGQIIAGGVELQSLLGDAIEPAAAAQVSGGGVGEYSDDLGEALSGVDRLGTLDSGFSAVEGVRAESSLTGGTVAPKVSIPPVSVGTLTPANDAPVAVDDSNATNEDTPVSSTLDLQSNDTDLDGDSLSVAGTSVGTFTTAQGGSIVVAADGSYTYTPAANFNGSDTFEYTVTDGALTDTGLLTITVGAINDAPVAVDDSNATSEGTPVSSTLDLQSNDTDLDGDSLSVAGTSVGTFTTVQGGSIVVAADGSYTYTPAANFNGSDTFEYTVTDGALTDTGLLTITVGAINDAPVAVDDSNATSEDTPVSSTLDLQSNDTDLDGDSLSVAGTSVGTFTTAQGGSIVVAADGSYTYTPAANFNGSDTFEYTVTDGALTDTGLLTITVGAINDAPVAVDDSNATSEDTPVSSTLDLQSNDTDLDGDSLSVAGTSVGTFTTAQGGSIVVAADGSYTYTPAANFNGSDTFEYTVTDGALTDTGLLTITVGAINDAPVAVDDSNATSEDTPVSSTLDLQSNDTDLDGDSLSVAGTSVGTFTTAQGGSIVVAADGSYTYTPAANFNGSDTFEYTVTDGALTDTGLLTITVGAINDAPVAVDDSNATSEDTPVSSTLDLQSNDTDLDGDSLSVAGTSVGTFTTVQGGSIVVAADGSYTYTPAANFNGSDTFEYTVTDGALTDTGLLTITVGAINDAPVAVDDSNATSEDTPVSSTLDLQSNDTDLDGDSLSVAGTSVGTFTTVQGGSIVVAADGSYTYTPAANFNGSDTFEYTVTDGALTDTGLLTITVGAINDAPVAVDDSNATSEDTPVSSTLDLQSNDTDLDGDSLSVAGTSVGTFTTAQGGSIVVAADGSYTYTPAANFNGSDTFEYTVTDGALTDTGLLTITVGAINDAPVAVDDSNATSEDTPVSSTLDLQSNDTDLDGDSLSVAGTSVGTFTTAQGGSIVVAADGSYTYTPAANFNGSDTFEYTVTDGALTDTGLLTITVGAINDAPVAVDDSNATSEDTPVSSTLDLQSNDTDLDGDSLSVAGTSVGTFTTVQGGSIVVAADGSYTYTPAANFNGSDTFEYTVTDGALTDTGLLTITVGAINDAPVAVDDSNATSEDTPVSSTLDLQSNDTDLDGDSLSVAGTSVGTFTTVQGGSIVVAADGSYTYTPAANFNGSDTFEYTVTDGALTDTGLLTITVGAINDAPVAVDDSNATSEDTPVSSTLDLQSNDTDLDGDSLSVAGTSVGTFTTAQGGSIVVAADGSYTYTPAANFNGSDTFEYTVTDGALTDTGLLTITVGAINDAPVAVDDSNATSEDTPVSSTLDLQSNDTDLDGDSLSVAGTSVGTFTTAQGGSIVVAADGSYTYTPAANFNGSDTFEYTVTDGALTDTGLLTITVGAINDAPVAVDDSNATSEDTPVSSTLDLQSNDTDLDGDSLSVAGTSVGTFTTVQGGSIVVAADGSYTYTPAANFNGSDTFEYTVTDGALTDTGLLTITVGAINDAPVAVDDSNATSEDTPVSSTLDLQSNDTDLDGDSLSVAGTSVGTFTTAQGGSIVVAADGSYTYTPAANFNGSDTFEYTVTDGALTDTGLLTITVGAINDAPVAVDDSNATSEGTPVSSTLDLQSNDTDLDGDSLSVAGTSVGTFTTVQGGSIVVAADGSYTYTPAANFNGSDTFEYTVTDGALTDTGLLTITVGAINDAPVAVDDSNATSEDTPVSSTLDLQSNDTDLDGDSLSVAGTSVGTFTTAQGGSIVVAADGSYTYTPAANFNGSDTFEYTVTDGALTDTGLLTITVGAINDAPVAVDDSNATSEDTPVSSTLDLQSNDTDLDGDSLSVAGTSVGTFTTAQGGSIVVAADGSYTYTPAANFNGSDTFEYTVTDGALTDTGLLTITVGAINDAPVAVDDSNATSEDTPVSSTLDLQSNDTDLDGDSLSVAGTSVGTFTTVQGGSIVVAADGSYTYTPAANFNGSDTFEYTVTDGALTDTGLLTITVGAINDAPVAVDDSNATSEDTPVSSTLDLQSNDTDLDGDSLSVAGTSVGTFTTVQGGSIVVAADGSYTYTPAANFNGSDTFEYTVTDGALTDTGLLTITVGAINDAPVAVDDSNATSEDTPVSSTLDLQSNDTDLDGDSLSVAGTSVGTFTTAQGGSIVVAADGSYTYTPAANFNGSDTFEYTVTDGALTDTGLLTITVGAINDAPVAVDDSNATSEDTPVSSTLDLQSNDTDLDGDSLSVAGTSVGTFTTAQGGSIVVAADGSYTYTPAANFNGSDTFEYTVTDGALTDTGLLTITVGAINDAPVAVDDSNATSEDTPVSSTLDLQSNDTDLDGDSLSVAGTSVGTFTTVQGGSIVVAADGSYTYTPAANFNGSDTFEYTVTDGALTDTGLLTITVGAINDAPVAVDDSNATSEDTPVSSTLDLQSNDTDLDGDSLSVAGTSVGTFTTAQGGSIVVAADGSYTYTPAANFNGSDTFEYTVTDGALTDTGLLTITVGAINDAPVAVDDSNATSEDTPVSSTLDLQSNDTDLDGDSLSVAGTSVGTFTTVQGGSIVVAADGSYTYTPAANFNGSDTFEYTVTDGALTDTGLLTITVGAINDAPVAVDDSNATSEDTPVSSTLDLQSNDTDLDGDSLSVAGTSVGTFTTAQGGSIVVAADGSYTYTPAANFNGSDTFEYTVTDGALTDTGLLTITVGAINDAPVAVDDSNATSEDTPVSSTLDLQSNDTDLDGDSLSVAGTSVGTFTTAQGGSIVVAADGSYTYTPAANFNGSDTFEYTVTDGALTDTGLLTITVGAINDAPVVSSSAGVVSEEGLIDGNSDTVGSDDTTDSSILIGKVAISDPDGDALSVTLTEPTTEFYSNEVKLDWTGDGTNTLIGSAAGVEIVRAVIDNSGAYTVTLSGPLDHSDATVEDSLTFDIGVNVDDGSVIVPTQLTVTVEDDAPIGQDDFNSLAIGESISSSVLTNDAVGADSPGESVTAVVFDSVAYTDTDGDGVIVVDTGTGVLNMSLDGSYTYDSSLYSSAGGSDGLSSWDDISITAFNGARTVESENEFFIDPVTFAPLLTNINDGTATGTLTVVDAVFDDGSDGIGIAEGAGNSTYLNGHPTHPEAILLDLGFSVDSINTNFYSGTNSGVPFYWATYSADGDLMEMGSGPISKPGFSLEVSNDSGEAFQYVVFYGIDSSASSKILLTGVDNIQYADLTADAFSYQLQDADGDSSTAVLTISQIEPSNTPPVAENDRYVTTEGTPITFDVLANDSDADGEVVSLWGYTAPGNGVVTVDASGNLVYTPEGDWSGTDTFTYTVRDESGGLDTATVSVTVDPLADAPSLYAHLSAAADQTFFADDFNDGDFLDPAWTEVKLTGDTFAEDLASSKTSIESDLFKAVAWDGQTSDQEWLDFWTVNNGELRYNAGGNGGSDDAQGMLAYSGLSAADGAKTNYAVEADIWGNTSSQQNNGVGIVFGYEDQGNYFLARWENPGSAYQPNGDLFNSYPGQANQLSLVQMIGGKAFDLGTFDNFSTPDWFNLRIEVSDQSIKVIVDDGSSAYDGSNVQIEYSYDNSAAAAQPPALNTIGMWVFDDDYGVAFDNVQIEDLNFKYDLDLAAFLNDTDGSESLSAVTLSNLPDGVVLTAEDGSLITVTGGTASVDLSSGVETTLTVTSISELSVAQVNGIGVSVTASELSGESATVVDDVKVELLGTDGDDSLTGTSSDEWIDGDAGNDILTGGGGADIFTFDAGDQINTGMPSVDLITDFDATQGGDVLDLHDLLQGEQEATMTEYLQFSQVDTDSDGVAESTKISIDQDGGDLFETTQEIVLQDVDLVGGGPVEGQDIINTLLANNNLITD